MEFDPEIVNSKTRAKIASVLTPEKKSPFVPRPRINCATHPFPNANRRKVPANSAKRTLTNFEFYKAHLSA